MERAAVAHRTMSLLMRSITPATAGCWTGKFRQFEGTEVIQRGMCRHWARSRNLVARGNGSRGLKGGASRGGGGVNETALIPV